MHAVYLARCSSVADAHAGGGAAALLPRRRRPAGATLHGLAMRRRPAPIHVVYRIYEYARDASMHGVHAAAGPAGPTSSESLLHLRGTPVRLDRSLHVGPTLGRILLQTAVQLCMYVQL
jgi:hypothetical protein